MWGLPNYRGKPESAASGRANRVVLDVGASRGQADRLSMARLNCRVVSSAPGTGRPGAATGQSYKKVRSGVAASRDGCEISGWRVWRKETNIRRSSNRIWTQAQSIKQADKRL